MPVHWVLASLGKTVLRPGGLDMTKTMLNELSIHSEDTAVEFAPGLGITAKMTLERDPNYIALEKDEDAAKKVQSYLSGDCQKCIIGTAEETGLDNNIATVVYGEAMLTMQLPLQKVRIINEAKRILKPGGYYAIHEMCLTSNVDENEMREQIRKDLVSAIRVNALPLTEMEWKEVLEGNGFEVEFIQIVPMHLLRLKRLIEDEGLSGVAKIANNVMTTPPARKRILHMKKTFSTYEDYLRGICIVTRLKGE